MLEHGLIQENHGINDLYHEAMQYNICLLHGSPRVIKLQPIFKVCNISYLHVLFHSS